MSIEEECTVKRLFVGGLFEKVTQLELSTRFSKYGVVESVEIHIKRDPTGAAVNTFAYLNINTTQDKLNKCISTYNRTKWNGKELKLQLSKENFLDRLQKEREDSFKQALEQSCFSRASPNDAAHERIRNMHWKGPPGTTNDELKNWVVGKYSRILPIVNIRRKDGIKLVRIDPVKYVHQIKMFDPKAADRNLTERPVLRDIEPDVKRPCFNGLKKNTVGDNEIIKDSNIKTLSDSDTSDSESSVASGEDSPDIADKSDVENSESSHAEDSDSSDAKDSGSSDAEVSDSSDREDSESSDDGSPNASDAEDSEISDSSSSEASSSISQTVVAGKVSITNLGNTRPDFSPPKINNGMRTISNGKVNITKPAIANSKTNIAKPIVSNDRASTSNPTTSNEKVNVAKPNILDRKVNVSHTVTSNGNMNNVMPTISNEKVARPTISNNKVNTAKPTISNNKRLESLQSRQNEFDARKSLIQQSLSSTGVGKNRVVFASSESESESPVKDDCKSSDLYAKDNKKDPPTMKMSLFGDDSSDDETELSNQLRIRPQYEGKTGMKLMAMERKFDDDRFKINERFLDHVSEDVESDDEDVGSHKDRESNKRENDAEGEQNTEADDLKGERRRAMEILTSIVGKKAVDRPRVIYDFKPVARYDPTAPDHEKFEVKKPISEKKKSIVSVKQTNNKTVKTRENVENSAIAPIPVVSSEKFVKVEENLLTNIFHNSSAGERKEFTLFGPRDDSDASEEEMETVAANAQKSPSFENWKFNDHKDDFGGEESDNSSDEKNEPNKVLKAVLELSTAKHSFFFKENDPRLNAGVNFFTRTKPIEELREEWNAKRPNIMESIRQQHRDALRKSKSPYSSRGQVRGRGARGERSQRGSTR